ncbi:hypothetical protein N7517_000228 [Penicillium concentricum]|uniref:Carrier domain-containing protein n=1 Tax=Penicillium concentricum TaxID=293559 RepID=A0A9W9VHP2_9EURO|nr:uncharacterized protein N7517_000228 [Penicillium concentricum]KAJ5382317.1 hypothetical protein N7517_000228 [Penicillium concentricum]
MTSMMAPPKTMPIAIIGMSCKFPGDVTTPEKLWQVCADGRNTLSQTKEARFNLEGFYHPQGDKIGSTNAKGAHFLKEDVSLFDASFFNFTSEVANAMDPQLRMQLESVYEAMESAGITITQMAGSSTSVFSGACFRDYHDSLMQDADNIPRYFLTGNGAAMFSNRISHFFDLRGPSLTVDTGCSTGLVALHLACQSLRSGESKMALVGGANIMLNPHMFISLSNLGFLSDDGKSYSFDSRASGYGRGDGISSLVLKPLSEAVRDGDPIRAVIRETAVNQDGKTSTITSPSRESQEDLIRTCYSLAGLNPMDTAYVEAHGTGTIAGDLTESNAIGTVFGEHRSLDDPLFIGSVKANLGHLESASGLASIIKTCMMLDRGLIPPSANFDVPNSAIDFHSLKLKAPTELTTWPSHKPRRVSISNFGYGGTNAHVIIEDGYHCHPWGSIDVQGGRDGSVEINRLAHTLSNFTLSSDEISRHIFVLSAKEEKTAKTMVENLISYLQKMRRASTWSLADLSHTLTKRRSDFRWRVAISAQSLDEVMDGLVDPRTSPVLSLHPPRVGFVFTGQGAQWFAMGRELMSTYPAFLRSLTEADSCLGNLGASWGLVDELLRNEKTSKINEPFLSFPLCVAIQISLVRLLVSWGISPTAVTGHSSGEISAAYAAGALTFREAMICAYFRGYLCNSLLEASDRRGGMLALGHGKEVAAKYLRRISSGKAMIACFNSPSSVTISGDVDAIEEIEQMAAADDVFARRLKVGCAYHSHHMAPMAYEYERILSQHLQVSGSFDGILFSSPVTGGLLESARELCPAHWVDNMVKPVLFENSLREMIVGGETREQNIDMLIEIGPHGALGGPIRQILGLPGLQNLDIPYASCLSRGQDAVKTMQDVACLLKVRGYDVNIEAVSFPNGSKVQRVIHDLPAYPWNHSVGYWYESPLHKEERVCEYKPHDLLGTRIIGSVPTEPTWRRRIRVSEIPWLRDHSLQSQMIFPGAGFVAIAIEAFSQIYTEVSGSQGGYELRDIELLKALLIPDTTEGIDLQLLIRNVGEENLNFKKGDKFHVYSLSPEGVWTEHCRGFICASSETAKEINKSSLLGRENSHGGHHLRKISPKDFYRSLQDIGLTFGPLFRNLEEIQATDSMSLATFSVPEIACNTPSKHRSDLLIHPITLDTAFHAIYSAIPLAEMKQMGLTIPIFVKSLYVSSELENIPHSIFKTSVHVNKTNAQGFEASLDVTVDGATSSTSLIKVEGMLCRSIDRESIEDHTFDPTLCLKTTWGCHLSFLTKDDLHCQLATTKDPKEKVIMGNLARAVFYISQEVLQSLTEEDQFKLEWHHKRLVYWMKHVHESCPMEWSLSTPKEKNSLLEEVSRQSINGEMLCRVGAKMMPILRKEAEPLTLMMEDGLLDRYYGNALKLHRSLSQVEKLVRLFAHTNPRSRVLEIGAGTGVCTAPVLRALGAGDETMSNPKLAQYDFTDISAGFFEAAREKFGLLNGRMNYLRLDIEEDPESQSFGIGIYDLVVACQVLHATKNMQRTMKNVRKLLKPGGRLILVESTQDEVDIQMVFGTLPGWWLSEEPERMLSPTLTVDAWTSLFDKSGFGGLDLEVGDCENRQENVISVMMVTASVEPESTPRANIAVILPSKQAPPLEWIDDLTQLIQKTTALDCSVHSMGQPEIRADAFIYLGDLDQPSLNKLTADEFHNLKVLIGASQYTLWITRGGVMNCESPLSALVTGFLRTLRLEDPSKCYISLDLDPIADSWTPQTARSIVDVLKSTFHDSWKVQRTEYEFAERQGQILVPRICEDYGQNLALAKQISEPEIQAQCFHQESTYLQLQAKSPGSLDSLVFSGGPNPLLADGMVEIIPLAFGLNFRDVLVALGQMQDGFMGFECAGVVIAVHEDSSHKFRVGDRVCALMTAGHWANRVQVPSTSVANMPDDMSFELGASIPMIYITAYHALMEIAHLEKGETILIHAAAGGVGQAAISLAKHIGAEIFVTVGSPKKRDFVHNTYGIPIDHIYSSRDTSFAQGIMSITNSRGVDVILNSLSGKLLQASWDCIAILGRFVEIGKRDIQQNRQLEMENFGRSVSFCAMDLVHLGTHKGEKVSRILGSVLRMIEEGEISPCTPITTFSISDLPQAFRTMQAGKHIGKIVVKADIEDLVNVIPRRDGIFFSPDSSYLIVGGLGGIGRSLAQWMAQRGAKFIVLASRHAQSPDLDSFLETFRGTGTVCVARQCDVSNASDIQHMVQQTEDEMPPIRGVVHAAMILQDALFENMTHAQWESALSPKVIGSLNLHNQFQSPDLQFFITLSSATGILGNTSQANYTAGCTYQDSLANYRATRGLPGISINLGSVKSVGAAANLEGVADHLERVGFRAHEEEEVLRLFQAAIHSPLRKPGGAQILSGIAPFSNHEDISWRKEPRFAGLLGYESSESALQRHGTSDNVSLKDGLTSSSSRSAAVEFINHALLVKLSSMFMIPESDINIQVPLAEYGVDSLVAVELRSWIVQSARADISVFDLTKSQSLSALAGTIVDQIWSKTE